METSDSTCEVYQSNETTQVKSSANQRVSEQSEKSEVSAFNLPKQDAETKLAQMFCRMLLIL